MSNTATAMTTKKETALSADKIPDFLQKSNLGNENVGAVSYTHLTLPTTPYV